ncbi:hypothetical protein SH580_01070 [Coraliomargarita algicola]|uniref:Uncharacterized protein n=1 Tax=Coraliomargarita algicola TaxID=3092156 RepID=A0ABZ0RMZ3_9BACT|nr:hypothetical protein [Coraliomargarita sp. J2-16]WPJ96292.1 hypothetical protein SH580_01070 [Coraliomargarita sp. J2-16]
MNKTFSHSATKLTLALYFAISIACSSIIHAQEETTDIKANLYLLLLRSETSSRVEMPNEAAIQSKRVVAWLTRDKISTANLESGRIHGPFEYTGNGLIQFGEKSIALEQESVATEAACQITQSGNYLGLLLPKSNNELILTGAMSIPLPDRIEDATPQNVLVSMSVTTHSQFKSMRANRQ